MASKVYRRTEARKRAIAEYSKQRIRIRNYVKSLQKRGIVVPYGFIPEKATSAEFRGLSTQQIKARAKKATGVKPETILPKTSYQITTDAGEFSEVITGEHYLSLKKHHKLEQYRSELFDRRNAEYNELDSYNYSKELHTESEENVKARDETQEQFRQQKKEEFEKRKKIEDEKARRQAEADAARKERFNEASIAIMQVENMLDNDYNRRYEGYREAKRLWERLKDEIGIEQLRENIMKSPEDIRELMDESIRYRPDQTTHASSLNALVQAMLGRPLTAKESKKLMNSIEKDDAYTDEEF